MQSDYGILLAAADPINHQQQNFPIPQQELLQSFPNFPIPQHRFPQQQQQKHFFPFLQQQQQQHEQHQQETIGLQQQRQQQQQQQQFPQFQEKQSNPLQCPAVNFKLGLNENSHGVGQETPLLHRNDSPSGKDPFWKLLNTMHEERQLAVSKSCGQVFGQNVNLNQKYRTFGELEAICGGVGLIQENHRTGSGSAMRGENCNIECPKVGVHTLGNVAAKDVRVEGGDHGSEGSIGEEALVKNLKRKRKREAMKDQLSSMSCFFERLIKKLMDHQEMLHKKFMERIERLDQERRKREERWRQQEAEKTHRQAIVRANEQALASRREAVILSYFEIITGQKIDLPSRIQPDNLLEPRKPEPCPDITNNARWPQAEVDALVQVRSSFETKFREAGLKGPLWDEISSIMGSMGYQRSAKRCKEKWENINKYFRKTKDGVGKRPRQSRTCSYFDQLDQLYSSSVMDHHLSPNSSNSVPMGDSLVGNVHKGKNSQLLEAILDIASSEKFSLGNFKDGEIGSSKLDSDENEIIKDISGHDQEGEEIEGGEEEEEDHHHVCGSHGTNNGAVYEI